MRFPTNVSNGITHNITLFTSISGHNGNDSNFSSENSLSLDMHRHFKFGIAYSGRWGIIKFNHRPTPTATALTTGIKERREHDKWQWYHGYTKIKKKRHENVFLCFLCKYFSLISQRAATVTVDIAYDILIRCLRNMNQLKFLHKAENIWRPKCDSDQRECEII